MRRGEDGFTLVESLVAFAVLAIALIYSGRVISENLNRMHHAQEATKEMQAAEEVLQHYLDSKDIGAGDFATDANGYQFHIKIKSENLAGLGLEAADGPPRHWLIQIYTDHGGSAAPAGEPLLEAIRSAAASQP